MYNEKDIDGVFEVLEVPLDGAQGVTQLVGRPLELLEAAEGHGRQLVVQIRRARDAAALDLGPSREQDPRLVQRLVHLAGSNGNDDTSINL